MKWALLIVAGVLPVSAAAQIVTGAAVAIDGDSLSIAGAEFRLHGIDAPEALQTCDRDGRAWQCGQDAKGVLVSLISDQAVVCEQRDTDRYGRIVARCTAGGIDLARAIIESGYAVALPQFSDAYVESEARVRAMKFGIWGSAFTTPAEYRAANPRQFSRPHAPRFVPPARFSSRVETQPQSVFYRNCAAARAAGAAPLYRGHPGYRSEMDGDNDGIACEPYYGR